MNQKHAVHQSGAALRLLTLLAAALALVLPLGILAAVPHWAPMSGTLDFEIYSSYGEMGVPDPGNRPSVMSYYPATCADATGGLWVFGGPGLDASLNYGLLNDLWHYDPASRLWTWMSGTGLRNAPAVYGQRGVPDSANHPKARQGGNSWMDAQGCFWLFGGYEYDSVFLMAHYLNDLWKYDPCSGLWTWMAGGQASNRIGVYGTLGLADPANVPGARRASAHWVDEKGRFWLFGGHGYGSNEGVGRLSDLWMFDPDTGQWTWMAGSNLQDQPGIYGTLGVSSPVNTPGARYGSSVWMDDLGRFWLFGGAGYDSVRSSGHLSDLWMYDPDTGKWTWMHGPNAQGQPGDYGTMGVPDPANVPGARYLSHAWTGPDGSLWLYGGPGYDHVGSFGGLSDLWKYDPEIGIWTWIKGSPLRNTESAVYETLGEFAESNTPGTRYNAFTWVDQQGIVQMADPSRWDFWKFDPTLLQWAAVRVRPQIPQPGVYGEQGVADPANTPGSRTGSGTWTDADGGRWMFGGNGVATAIPSGRLNDLWRFDPPSRTWTWIKGSSEINKPGVYGGWRTPAPDNTPGARYSPATWTDSQGGFWLFGGYGHDGAGKRTPLNDLWHFDTLTQNWTWMKGPAIASPVMFGVYGTQGVPHSSNIPGSRFDAITWNTSDGGLWLFGGWGYDSTSNEGHLNDLWRYDPGTGNWTWMSGSTVRTQTGIYASRGTPNPMNAPGSRSMAVSWTDSQGNLWLFGGSGYDGLGYGGALNDVWSYDPASGEWTWHAGSPIRDQRGLYGEQGRAASTNSPGGRSAAVAWTDKEHGLFWLLGGDGYAETGSYGFLSDMWSFDPATKKWTWVKGPRTLNQAGVGRVYGDAKPSNIPGARRHANAWSDSRGELWLFGGEGYDLSGYKTTLGNMWRASFTKPHADEDPGPGDVLVLTEFTDAWVSRLQGGGFAAPAHLGFIGFRHDATANWSTLAGDFDGDGFTDLVTITADGEAWTATFDAPDAFSVPNKQSSGWRADPAQGHVVLAGDVNGDGLTDLMQLRPDGELVWAINNAGALGEPTELQVTMLRHDPGNGLHVFAHDVDGDGKTDLVQADNVAGTLTVARSLTTGFDALQPWSSDDWLHDPDAKAALHFGDFNGDARADVLEVRDSAMRVALSTETALGNAIDAGTLGFHDDPARGEGWWVFPGDVDQDGLDDLIQINEFGEAWVAKSLGAGTFETPPQRNAQLGFHHKPDGTWQIFVGHARK